MGPGRGVPRPGAALPGADGPPKAKESALAVLADKCLACHSADPKKGGLDLTRRASALAGGESGPAVVPGKPGESLLIERLEAGEMPPEPAARARGGRRVPGLGRVGGGLRGRAPGRPPGRARLVVAPADPHGRPSPRSATGAGSGRRSTPSSSTGSNATGLRPAPEADRATYIRRVTFDLTGLPPTPEEVDAFVERPVARRLRAAGRPPARPRPDYGERWGRHWLDVVRFAESHGYETNQPPARRLALSRLRDPGLQPRHAVRPVRRGAARRRRARPAATGSTRSATGFLVGGPHDIVGNQTVEGMLQQRADDLDDMITATGDRLPRPDRPLRPLPRPQVRPDRPARLLRPPGRLRRGQPRRPRGPRAPTPSRGVARPRRSRPSWPRVERELDEPEPLARPDLGAAGPAAGRPAPERRAVRAGRRPGSVRFTIQATSDGTEPCIDELEVWTAGPDPAERRPGLGRGQGRSPRPTYPELRHPPARTPQRRPGRQRPELDLRRRRARGGSASSWPEAATIDRVVWGRDREGSYRDRTPTDYYIEVADRARPTGGWSPRRPTGPPSGRRAAPAVARAART